MRNKVKRVRACENSDCIGHWKAIAGRNVAGSRLFTCILCLFLIPFLCGCSLAVSDAGEESGGDRMIGGLITREFLDMLPAGETEGGSADADPAIHSAQEGKLYAKIDKSKGEDPVCWELSFGDLNGIQMLAPLWPMENGDTYWGNVCTEGLSDPDLRYNESDDSEEHSISGIVYLLSGTGNTVCYANPVYQRADGSIYVSQGHGISASGDSPEGMELSSTLSGETTTMENGKTKTEKCSVSIRYVFMDKPVRITVCQMDRRHRVIKEEDYRPGDMPEELSAEAGTEYILVEIEKESPSGEKTVSREVYDYPADEEIYLTSFFAREDGIVVKRETRVL